MARYEADPVLQQLVDRYDESGLVIKTTKQLPNPTTQYNEPESDGSKRAREAVKRNKK
jgi:hypothetical protein